MSDRIDDEKAAGRFDQMFRPLHRARGFTQTSVRDALALWLAELNEPNDEHPQIDRWVIEGKAAQVADLVEAVNARIDDPNAPLGNDICRAASRWSRRAVLLALREHKTRLECEHGFSADVERPIYKSEDDKALAITYGRWFALYELVNDLELAIMYRGGKLPLS